MSHFATLDQDTQVENVNVLVLDQGHGQRHFQARDSRHMPETGLAVEAVEGGRHEWTPHQGGIDVKYHRWPGDVLSDAIRRGQFVPRFQAKVNFSTDAVIGAHLLPAWEHPELGLLTAPFFMADMASHNLVQPLTESVLKQALAHLQSWGNDAQLTLTIGLPVCLLEMPGTAHRLAVLAGEFHVACHRLSVIVTDAPCGPVSQELKNTLKQLQGYGFGLILGDVATGLFSLRMLQEFAFDEINLGQSLTTAMSQDPRSLVIADAVITLCKQLGIRIIAEGIETSGDCAMLRAAGCDFGLGRHFSGPASPRQFDQVRITTHFCDDTSNI